MEFTTTLQKFDTPLWSYHIPVPEEISRHFLESSGTRVVCTLNHAVEFQCALMPRGDQSYFINVNKKIRDKLALNAGDPVKVELKADTSTYGLPMPEELAALLELDAEGDRLFHALTPGKQRNLLYIAGSPKTTDTRLKKAVVIIEHLKTQNGKIDFKRLNEEMKDANRR